MPRTPAPRAPKSGPKDESFAQVVRSLGFAGPLALIAAVLPALGGFALLGTLHIVGPWLRGHEVAGVLLYVVAFMTLAGFALLPTYAQAVLGGWAFGFAIGTPAAVLGFVGAGLIGYVVARRAASRDVMSTLNDHPTWRAVRDALIGQGFWRTLGLVTLIRLPLNSPFALTNLVLGSARAPIAPYMIGTAIGMTPRTAGAVWVAASIEGELTREAAQQARPDWFIPVAIGSVVVVALIVTRIANKAIKRVAAGQKAPGAGADRGSEPGKDAVQ